MRKFSFSMAAFACFCLLTMQVSGLHLHVGASGSEPGLHGTHAHQVVTSDHGHEHGHGHSAEVDIQLLEQLSISWSKLIPLISQVIFFLAVLGLVRLLWSPPIKSGNASRRLHWRPQLRAPPTSL
jgi:hypothetical protein